MEDSWENIILYMLMLELKRIINREHSFSDCVVKWNRDWDRMELMILEITLSLKGSTGTTLEIVSCYFIIFTCNVFLSKMASIHVILPL